MNDIDFSKKGMSGFFRKFLLYSKKGKCLICYPSKIAYLSWYTRALHNAVFGSAMQCCAKSALFNFQSFPVLIQGYFVSVIERCQHYASFLSLL